MKSDPLWQLNKLANLDKHVTIGYSHTTVQFRFSTVGVPEPPWISHEETQEVECLIPLAHKGKVQIKPEPPELVFGKPIDAPGADFTLSELNIAEIHRYVRDDVLPRFARFFPKQVPHLSPPT